MMKNRQELSELEQSVLAYLIAQQGLAEELPPYALEEVTGLVDSQEITELVLGLERKGYIRRGEKLQVLRKADGSRWRDPKSAGVSKVVPRLEGAEA